MVFRDRANFDWIQMNRFNACSIGISHSTRFTSRRRCGRIRFVLDSGYTAINWRVRRFQSIYSIRPWKIKQSTATTTVRNSPPISMGLPMNISRNSFYATVQFDSAATAQWEGEKESRGSETLDTYEMRLIQMKSIRMKKTDWIAYWIDDDDIIRIARIHSDCFCAFHSRIFTRLYDYYYSSRQQHIANRFYACLPSHLSQ